MEVYLGRQPILDTNLETVAYELLYRSGSSVNAFTEVEGSQASSQVLYNLFYGIGPEEVTGGKKAFINFTKELLVTDIVTALDPRHVVIEILEDVIIDRTLIEACRELVKHSFTLALDDFILKEGVEELLRLASIVKIDWLADPYEKIVEICETVRPYGVELLAEKIEAREKFDQALELGCNYFQGYFFAKPIILQNKDIYASHWSWLKIMRAIQRPEFNLQEVNDIITSDVALSYKLLMLVNSAAFARQKEISSIRQALVILGEKEVRRWLTLLLMSNLCEDKPQELMVTAVVRARFGELLAKATGRYDLMAKVFLAGVLSLLNTMMGRPLKELLAELPLDPAIPQVLLQKEGVLAPYVYLVLAYEKGNEQVIEKCAGHLKLDYAEIRDCYLEAIKWTDTFLGS